MRVLIVSQFYPPEPDPTMHTLAKGLAGRGHTVTVLTGFPNWPTGGVFEGYRQRPWAREVMDGVRVIRVPLYPDHSRSRIRRSLNYLSFAASASVLGPFLTGGSDVVLIYHPPATLAIPGFLIAAVARAPVIYQVQDMWPETLAATGMVGSRAVLKLMGALCSSAYRWARTITVHTPGQKLNLVAKGVSAAKIHFVLNPAYEGDFEPVRRDPELARQLGFERRFNIVYTGNIGPAQGLENVLRAAERLADLPDLQFVLVGDGIDRAALEAAARRIDLGNVRFTGRLPIEKMPAIYALADALLVHLKNDPLFDMTIPGKTQSYLAAGRPILASIGHDAATLVRDAGAGLVARPSDPEALATASRALHAMTPEERVAMGASGRRFFEAHLAPAVLLETWVSLIDEAVA